VRATRGLTAPRPAGAALGGARGARGAKSGGGVNQVAAEHLLNGFRGRLMRVARENSRCASDAEDAFARTVELTLRSCPIEGDFAQVEAWATVVCRREAWKIARRYRRKPADSLEALAEAHGDSGRRWRDPMPADRNDPSPEERALDAETLREVHAAIDELSASQRRAIAAYARGWTSREIAEALGRSHRSVRKALWRGKRTVRARVRTGEER
jgi:RNA polymerase sigma factor (sigma-70 family)